MPARISLVVSQSRIREFLVPCDSMSGQELSEWQSSIIDLAVQPPGRWVEDILTVAGAKIAIRFGRGPLKTAMVKVHGYSADGSDVVKYCARTGISLDRVLGLGQPMLR